MIAHRKNNYYVATKFQKVNWVSLICSGLWNANCPSIQINEITGALVNIEILG